VFCVFLKDRVTYPKLPWSILFFPTRLAI
jgi:hypothetical protein